ncbi:MAG: hypothetical protein ACP5OX_01525 [Minisyncoccia bacterium]
MQKNWIYIIIALIVIILLAVLVMKGGKKVIAPQDLTSPTNETSTIEETIPGSQMPEETTTTIIGK